MAREFAEDFYNSRAWKECRKSYTKYRRGLCERCLSRGQYSPGEIVHHKVYISPENIMDPSVTLCFDNLELLCRKCHGEEHSGNIRRYTVSTDGHVTAV